MDESEEESERNYFYNDVTDSRENECMSKGNTLLIARMHNKQGILGGTRWSVLCSRKVLLRYRNQTFWEERRSWEKGENKAGRLQKIEEEVGSVWEKWPKRTELCSETVRTGTESLRSFKQNLKIQGKICGGGAWKKEEKKEEIMCNLYGKFDKNLN